jgi:Raf kinase inhibitor-like YbhB/YbcL family protein
MSIQLSSRISLVAGILSALCICQSTYAAAPFLLTSSAFKDGMPLVTKNAGNLKANPNCIGENVSPPLSWSNAPEGTKSLALMIYDPEGALGLGVSHMVTYGIAPSVSGFAEGELSKPSNKFVGGKNVRDLDIYYGPCPVPGSGMHHYTFTLIATDLEVGALPAGLTRQELLDKLKGHAKGGTSIVGMFGRP